MSKEQVEFLTRTQLAGLNAFVFNQAYGSFSSSHTQPFAVAPNRTALTYDRTDLAGGGMILGGATPTADILLPAPANYRAITSVQLNNTNNTKGFVYIWFSLDGVPIPNTATKSAIDKGNELVMTVEVLFTATAGQRLSVEGYGTINGEEALAEMSANPSVAPDIPSIITIVQRIA
jgi:hypothetical protein